MSAAVVHKTVTDMVVENIAEESCKKAIGFNRAGRHGRAEYELVRAGMRIAALVDDQPSVEVLAELHLFEPFHDQRRGDVGGDAA